MKRKLALEIYLFLSLPNHTQNIKYLIYLKEI